MYTQKRQRRPPHAPLTNVQEILYRCTATDEMTTLSTLNRQRQQLKSIYMIDGRRLPGLEVLFSSSLGFGRERSTERRLLRLRLKRQTLRGPGDPLGTKSSPNRAYTRTITPKRSREGVKEGRKERNCPVSSYTVLGVVRWFGSIMLCSTRAHCSSVDSRSGKKARNTSLTRCRNVTFCHAIYSGRWSARFGINHPGSHEEGHIARAVFHQVQ